MEKRIYLLFDKKEIDVVVPNNSEALDKAIRVAIGADPDEGLSLKDNDGNPLLLTPRLPGNTPSNRYHVQRLKPKGMLIDEVQMDLLSLENRVTELEKNLQVNQKALPSVLKELKHDVARFRHKLETTKHLSWLSCYKELPPSSRKIQYRRRSDAKQKVVREQFLQICEQVITEEVRQCLRLSSFDCMQWSDEEILLLLQFMFIDLDLIDKFNIDMTTLRSFLFQVYKNYNEVPFHNFRHCFCVAQMMYAMAIKADLVKRIGSLEVLILIVSCICHDLDHPGYNNIYQINARTELALRYNDISPLENHHCSIAFRILELEECNIFKCFDYETYKTVREGIIRCILATDMARHNEILAQFREATLNGFDYYNKAHVNLLCMVLIKVADISNEARPMDVAEPWLDRLLEEFFTQSDAEKEEGLPVTPFMDREKITKPSSQCSFIGFVLLPLFEALGDLLTELVPMIVEPVRSALEYYRRLNEAHHKNSTVDGSLPSPTKLLSKSSSICSMRRKLSTSLSNNPDIDIDEPLPDIISSDDEATVNEVAVSEKALKFKISTETASIDRKSYPGSRKGSREKYPHDHQLEGLEKCESCLLKNNFKDRSFSLIEPDWRHPHRNKPRMSVESPEAIKEFSGLVGEGHDEKIPEEAPTKSPNLINRIKNFGGRFSKSIGDSPSKLVPPSPSSLKSQRVSVDRESRASTLPKVSRKRFGSEARKGWRSLLKKRDDGASSKPNGLSQETLGEGETSVNNNRKKKEKGECSSSPSTQRQKWVQSLVSSFRGKKSNTQDATKS